MICVRHAKISIFKLLGHASHCAAIPSLTLPQAALPPHRTEMAPMVQIPASFRLPAIGILRSEMPGGRSFPAQHYMCRRQSHFTVDTIHFLVIPSISPFSQVGCHLPEPPAMVVFGYLGKLALDLTVIGCLSHIPVTTSTESSQSASPTLTGFVCFNGIVGHLPPCVGLYSFFATMSFNIL